MLNFVIPFFASWLYVCSTYYDFSQNRELYSSAILLKRIDNLFWNVFFFLPLSLIIILTIQPVDIYFYSIFQEAYHLLLNIIFGEIWFYTWHRIMHTKLFYKYHKTHHELTEPIGIYALYAHPIDAIFVNLGSLYFLHYLVKFSIFQIYLVGSWATINTVVNSHSGRKQNFHQTHHKKFNVNYGLNLFMDHIFGTSMRIQENKINLN